MIEIKQGWTGKQAFIQNDVKTEQRSIAFMREKLKIAEEKIAKLQAECDHQHVVIGAQRMTCDICGKELEE